MDMSRRRLISRIGGGLAVLVVAAGLSAAGATASSAQQSKVLAAETLTCGASRSATVDGATFQLEPCVRRGDDMYGGGEALSGIANVTITADPAQPVNVCRLTASFREAGATIWRQVVVDCLSYVDAGPTRVESTQFLNPIGITSGTTLVTVEFAAVDGPLKVVSTRATLTGF
ncbi:hypothetical protein [Phytohabitans rumicis]|uniref:Lipoprotein n=1 Tax=Phytohabitans rumicis TaxID=1076125 RepID=A0A6V8KZX9_9ACTN|nr:hypothetical protein [Phytohabitans rumicis]GFJ87366.1 hypothetical protein Prum_010080 [Phytohabitans rumicis]